MNLSFLRRRKVSFVRIVPFGLAFLVSYIFLSVVFSTSAQAQTPAVGQMAPDFTLQTTTGQAVDLTMVCSVWVNRQ
jgi:hypothetical protein